MLQHHDQWFCAISYSYFSYLHFCFLLCPHSQVPPLQYSKGNHLNQFNVFTIVSLCSLCWCKIYVYFEIMKVVLFYIFHFFFCYLYLLFSPQHHIFKVSHACCYVFSVGSISYVRPHGVYSSHFSFDFPSLGPEGLQFFTSTNSVAKNVPSASPMAQDENFLGIKNIEKIFDFLKESY